MIRKTSFVLALALSLSFAGVASAEHHEEAGGSPISLAVDGAFVLPLGDWADASGPGIGAMLRAAYQLQAALHLTGRVGYIFGLPKDQGGVDLSVSLIPIMVGVRYFVGPVGLDVATGIMLMQAKASVDGNSMTDSNTRIPLLLGVSHPIGSGALEIGAALLIPNLLLTEDGEDMQTGILATVGWGFM